MDNVYVVSVYHGINQHVEPIKQLNPDKIICWSDAEYDAEFIFNDFTQAITPWAIENNKTIDIIYPGPDKKINNNVILRHSFGYYLINRYIIFLRHQNKDFTNVHQQANKLYTLYCNRGSDERLRIVDTFVRENMLDQGVVIFRGAYYPDPVWQYHDGSPLIDEVHDTDDLFTEAFDLTEYAPKFFNGLVDVVCESKVDNGQFFFTEKTTRSLVALKPFLALASQYYHRYLQEEFGIEPYTELFDYSFDSYENVNDRVEAIVENIKNLANKSNDEIHELVIDKMIYNKNKFLDYGKSYEKMVPNSLEFLLDNNFTLHGDTFALNTWLSHVKHNGFTK